MRFKFEKKQKGGRKEIFAVRLGDDDHDHLEALMKKLHMNKSQVIRYLAENARAQLEGATPNHTNVREYLAKLNDMSEHLEGFAKELRTLKDKLEALEGV
jgi:hypothetical protein